MHALVNTQKILLVFIFAISIISVNAQNRWSRYEALVGVNGESSCDLHTMLLRCPRDPRLNENVQALVAAALHDSPIVPVSSPDPENPAISIVAPPVQNLERRDDPTNPVAGRMNMCTCNPTGFNIWSACRYSMGFAEQPALNDWMLACKNASVDLPGAQALSSEPDGLGFKVPTWALVSAPGGKYFDMQSATRIALLGTLKPGWTPVQIILPIITAIVSAFLVILIDMQMKAKQYVESQNVWANDTEAGMCASSRSDTSSVVTRLDAGSEVGDLDHDTQVGSPTDLERISMRSGYSSASSISTVYGEHLYDVKLSDDGPISDEAKTESQ